jgi:hypothetical protein
MSFPYKQYPISSLNVSLEANPAGRTPNLLLDLNIKSQISSAISLGTYSSKPPDPVYPVAEKITSLKTEKLPYLK